MRDRSPESSRSIGANQQNTPWVRINVLGKFQLIRGETPVTEKEWSSAKKSQMFLKAVITRGGENVAADLIMDDLWPETSLDEARKNFRVVLHRLRKILGPADRTGPEYIASHRNMVSLNRSLVSLDIDKFLLLCKDARRSEQAGELKDSIDFGNAAIELYKGDYLEDELYTPWTMLKREETRAVFIDVLRRTASLYERQGNSRKSVETFKLLIKADPVLEEAYRRLMSLYSSMGMRSEAIRTYNECKRVLDRELGTEPDELTTSIYRRIAEPEGTKKGSDPLDLDRPGSYTPKYLAEKILTNRSSIKGERKVVTVMFAEVANYSAIFEGLDLETLHEIMEGFFRLLLDEVHRYEGTVNQFWGDGLMALFGAPVAHEDHAQRACHSALAIQNALAPYAESLKGRYGIDLQVRIGLNAGPVVVGSIGNDLRMDYTAKGDTVNLAAAMENNAEAGDVLVTGRLYKLAGEFFDFEPVGTVPVKAKGKSVEAYRLVKPTMIETRFAASAAARGLTRFIGRTREIRALTEAFESAREGEGRVLGIVGEAGVGKSRLLFEFKGALPKNGCRYFEGRCFHYGRSMPYLPLLDVLRSFIGVKEGEQEHIIRQKLGRKVPGADKKLRNIIPPLQDLLFLDVEDGEYAALEPKQKRQRIFEAIRDLLVRIATVRPVVLAIEDLHWIDRTTEEFLDRMIGWLPGTRILLLLLYRPEYTHQWGRRPCYGEIQVGQLSVNRSAELVAAILRGGHVSTELSELILGKSSGNPFFMEELTCAMIESGAISRKGGNFSLAQDLYDIQIPDTIQGVIASRMDRLEENLKHIVQVAAVIGREFAFRILETILETKDGLRSRLLDLQRLELIFRKAPLPELEYVFRHALTQEVAYDGLLTQKRKEIHERIGLALEELYRGRLEQFYEMLAWHYSHSNNQDKACRFLKLSGRKAIRNNSHREAFRLFKEALDLLRRMEPTAGNKRDRLEILHAMVDPMRALGYPEGSIELLRDGEALAKELGDDKAVTAFFSHMGFYFTTSESDRALAKTCFEKALASSELLGDVDVMASVVCNLAGSYTISGDLWKICEVVPRYIELIEKTGTQSETFARKVNIYSLLKAQYGMAMAGVGNFDIAERILKQCREFIRERRTSNAQTLAQIEINHCAFYLFKGDGRNVVDLALAAVKLGEKSQLVWNLGIFWAVAGHGCLLLEQAEKAVGYLEKGLKVHLDSGMSYWHGYIHAGLAMAHLQLGNLEEALFHGEQGVKLSVANDERCFGAVARTYLGRVLGMCDPARFDEAREHILQAIKTSDALKLKPTKAAGLFHLAELSASFGRTAEAMEFLRKAQAMFREMGMDHWLGRSQEVLARL